MEKNTKSFDSDYQPIHRLNFPLPNSQRDDLKDILDLNSEGKVSQRSDRTALSSRTIQSSRRLTAASSHLEAPNQSRHTKSYSLAKPSSIENRGHPRTYSRENLRSDFLINRPIDETSPRGELNYKLTTASFGNQGLADLSSNTFRDHDESLGNIFKNSYIKLADAPSSYREKVRTKSIGNTSQLDLSLQPSKSPVQPSKTSSKSQAYTNAMKALQEKIRQLEEKIKTQEEQREHQENLHKIEIEKLDQKHQAEISQFAHSEREQKERSEQYERNTMEVNCILQDLEKEKAEFIKKIQILLDKTTGIRYNRDSLGKIQYQELYQDIEEAIKEMERELDQALQGQTILQARLQQTIIETATEKETLKAKNSALADALRILEKDYNECKNMYTDHLQEAAYKNEQLLGELDHVKSNYSQQMADFEHELVEIEQSNKEKAREYENTIYILQDKFKELEELNNIKQNEIDRLRKQLSDYVDSSNDRYMLRNGNNPQNNVRSSHLRKGSNYIEAQNPETHLTEQRLQASDKKSQSLGSPLSYFKSDSDFLHSDTKTFENTDTDDIFGPSSHRSPLQNYNDQINIREKPSNRTKVPFNPTDLNKENYNLTQTSVPTTPAVKSFDRELDKYLSSGEDTNRLLNLDSSKKKKHINVLNTFTAGPSKSEAAEPRESSSYPKNMSFGNLDAANRGSQSDGLRIDVNNLNPKDISNNIVKRHREELVNSMRGSTRSLSKQTSQIIAEKLSEKENELSRLNEEYQITMKKNQVIDLSINYKLFSMRGE